MLALGPYRPDGRTEGRADRRPTGTGTPHSGDSGPHPPGEQQGSKGWAPWIFALKYGGRADLAQPLGALLARSVDADLEGGARGVLVVPVPLHPLRRIERGYDQADLLARGLARGLGVQRIPLLRRARWGAPQGSPLAAARTVHVRGAFRLRRRFTGPDLDGRAVLLVDDVATSGATLAECARVLRAGGAGRVWAAVVARAGPAGSRAGRAR